MMKKVIIFSLIFSVVAIILGQSASQCCKTANSMTEDKNCSQVVESMKLCVDKSLSKVNEDNKVIINVTLTNLDKKKIEIPRRGFDNEYDVKIYDPSGNKLLSKTEKLNERYKNGKATMEEMIESLPVYSGPASTIIEPNQEIPIEFNLSQIYDFTEKGKYKIEISRKVPNKAGTGTLLLSADAIEIEIK